MMEPIKVKYDGKIHIAKGRTRYSKSWKNVELMYSEFLQLLQEPTRTQETVAEYAKLSRMDQDRIKDVGGFVGGYLRNGRRMAGSVETRYLITLDVDFADKDFLPDLDITLGDCAYVVYSTHKHTPQHPRLRLVIPLARGISPEASEAVGRMIAKDLDIDRFDDTTYQAERLMYWPSCSKDGDYVYYPNDAPFLDPMVYLNRYQDWRDCSSWPESSRAPGIRQRSAKKQGDPLKKEGLIGAFCRAYDIDAAIAKFLPKVYEHTGKPGRYTYSKGSTAAGLVVYEGKFAYSHHGTDPAGGQLLNSFDLVRIHLYGDKDEDPSVDIAKRPSFLAMQELAGTDDGVRKELNREIVAGFDDADSPGETSQDKNDAKEDNDWMNDLQRTKKGLLESVPGNFKLILQHDPHLKGRVGYNGFNYRREVLGKLPWPRVDMTKTWSDRDDSCLRNYLHEKYQGLHGPQMIQDACAEVFDANYFHPVRDFILRKPWDGVPRAETIWIDYLGADDTAYTRTVSRKHLCAAVARVFEPGIKFDNVIVLSGPQGIGKSTMLKFLGATWHNDSIQRVDNKDAYDELKGSWIIELAELSAAKRAENEAVKQFLSKTEDTYRPAYGRHAMSFPRQCVFYGSFNTSTYLRDRTGNRRFWPMPVNGGGSKSFTDFTPDVVQQVWAEAYQLWKDGESLYLDKATEQLAIQMQEEASEEPALKPEIENFLSKPIPKGWYGWSLAARRNYFDEDDADVKPEALEPRTKICAQEIWCECLGRPADRIGNMDARDINSIIEMLHGWSRSKNPLNFGTAYGKRRAYVCNK